MTAVSLGWMVERSQIILYRDTAVLGQNLQGYIFRPVAIGHIPKKHARKNRQGQQENSTC